MNTVRNTEMSFQICERIEVHIDRLPIVLIHFTLIIQSSLRHSNFIINQRIRSQTNYQIVRHIAAAILVLHFFGINPKPDSAVTEHIQTFVRIVRVSHLLSCKSVISGLEIGIIQNQRLLQRHFAVFLNHRSRGRRVMLFLLIINRSRQHRFAVQFQIVLGNNTVRCRNFDETFFPFIANQVEIDNFNSRHIFHFKPDAGIIDFFQIRLLLTVGNDAVIIRSLQWNAIETPTVIFAFQICRSGVADRSGIFKKDFRSV